MTDEKDNELTPEEQPVSDEEKVDQPSESESEESSGADAESVAESSDAEIEPEAQSSEIAVDSAEPEAVPDDESKVVNEDDESEDDAEAAMLAMLEELPDEGGSAKAEDIDFGAPEVSGAEFQQLTQPAGDTEPSNIDLLMDVDLPVAIELGRTSMAINDILALGPGSVVELNKLAGEPVDLLVNSKVVARGEVVVVDENFGLRVTHLLTPEERLQSLAQE